MSNKNEVLSETEKALYKEINLFQKRTFRKFLIDAITNEDKEAFAKVVEIIGIQWGVKRTVSNKGIQETEQEIEYKNVNESGFEKFTSHLFDKAKDMLNGEYNDWCNSKFKAYSYESKICFLLNPNYYKIIYDEHNKKASDFKLDDKKQWQNHVENYYRKIFGENHNFTIDDYFLNDCNLWLKGWK